MDRLAVGTLDSPCLSIDLVPEQTTELPAERTPAVSGRARRPGSNFTRSSATAHPERSPPRLRPGPGCVCHFITAPSPCNLDFDLPEPPEHEPFPGTRPCAVLLGCSSGHAVAEYTGWSAGRESLPTDGSQLRVSFLFALFLGIRWLDSEPKSGQFNVFICPDAKQQGRVLKVYSIHLIPVPSFLASLPLGQNDEFFQANMIHRLSFSQTTPPSSQDSQSRSERSENPSSSVRLRRSLDGQAQLVPADSSPGSEDASPGLIARAPRVLQRSHTDIGSVCLPSFSTLTKDLPSPIQPSHPVPRLSRGRSRDVHAWESCADADAPDELTALAERESSGSAIAAISMIRYTNVLQPSGPGKRNASVSRGSQSALHPAKKSKLSRTTSSLARLETPSSSPFLAENIDKARLEKIAVTTLLGSPTDSDKENLTPDEDGEATQQQQTTGRHRRRRPLPSAANGPPRSPRPQGGILHISAGSHLDLTHHKTAAAKTSFRRRGAARGDADVAIFEDHESEAADSSSGRQTPVDVARMARAQVSPSKTVEADCVAGLLSLSQGQWR